MKFVITSITKNVPEFWKSWNAKFRKNVSKNVNINGFTDDVGIASEFAKHFKNVYDCSAENCETADEFLHNREERLSDSIVSNYECLNNMTVELVARCLNNMRKGKTCGPDNLCAEHLID